MSLTDLLPYAIFGLITFLVWSIAAVLMKDRTRADERLDELRDPSRRRGTGGAPEEGGMKGMLNRAAPTISKAIQPKTDLEQDKLKVRLANAGFNSPGAPQLYLAIKVMMLVAGGVIGTGYGLANFGLTYNGLVSFVIGGGAGFYLPELALMLMVKKRQEEVFLGLPDVLDLLVVCVEAGLGLDAGMRRVAEELEDSHKAVTEEMNLCNMQLQMGRPRREVLHDIGIRTGVDDMKALAAILIQADKFGSSIAQALRVQSDSMRVKRRQLAEERAQQTAVKMIFPLVLFIFPGIFVVLVGPAAIMMIDGLLTT
ncbi:type II secretion system F family protein [Stratiformator vulcanicus]|uniref:Bacterial type II secretion system protein F domain protein n=1 Tax=Stratiformator vulcanicus TaxID=2527980 RepID=A0A517R4M6_9PLAN|nr:type II secretion system F family protein [Stratiformator vulcanicus]QDT38835.1 Bacterial type II secretion system protein F domain protein [Stratiformator vulcanicus]